MSKINMSHFYSFFAYERDLFYNLDFGNGIKCILCERVTSVAWLMTALLPPSVSFCFPGGPVNSILPTPPMVVWYLSDYKPQPTANRNCPSRSVSTAWQRHGIIYSFIHSCCTGQKNTALKLKRWSRVKRCHVKIWGATFWSHWLGCSAAWAFSFKLTFAAWKRWVVHSSASMGGWAAAEQCVNESGVWCTVAVSWVEKRSTYVRQAWWWLMPAFINTHCSYELPLLLSPHKPSLFPHWWNIETPVRTTIECDWDGGFA